MFKHYLLMALRQFRRHKLTTLINIGCLTLGLSCFIAVYGVYSYYRLSDRELPNSERIYFVSRTYSVGGPNIRATLFPWRAAPALQAEFPEFEAIARASAGLPVTAEFSGQQRILNVMGVDDAFLRIIPLRFVRGDALHAIDRPGTAILSAAAARRMYGGANPVGRTLVLQGGTAVEITAVAAPPVQPSHLNDESFDVIVPASTYRSVFAARNGEARAASMFETWQQQRFATYVLLRRDAAGGLPGINARLQAFFDRQSSDKAQIGKRMQIQPIAELAAPSLGGSNLAADSFSIPSILLMLGSAVLAIACLNYAMIAVAQSRSRMREIGLRRAVGAGALQVAQQQLTETLLLATLSYLAAFACILLLLPVLHAVAGIDLLPALMRSVSFWLSSVGVLFIVICIAGAYPAMVMSGYRPAQTLRGTASAARSSRFSMVLTGVQFGVVGFLLIAVLIVRAQNDELRRVGLLPDKDPVVVVNNDLRTAKVDAEALRAELERQPFVKSVSFTRFMPWSGNYSISCCIEGPAPLSRSLPVSDAFIAYDYFQTLGVPMLAGRDFDRNHGEDVSVSGGSTNVVIDQVSATALGWSNPQNAVDQVLSAPSQKGPPKRYRIIGVAASRDTQLIGPDFAIKLYTLAPETQLVAHVRISKTNVAAGLASIDTAWRNLGVRIPLERRFLDELFEDSFKRFSRNAAIVGISCLIAIGIALVGLIAMAMQIVGERRREIGIRKTLGANVSRIVAMILRDFSKPVLIANLLIWPVALLAAREYLSMFIQRTEVTAAPFIASLLIAVVTAWAAVGFQALRAARVRPADVLRFE